MAIAGGIAAALYKRKATGVTSVVDVSLLGMAAFAMTPRITASNLYGDAPLPTLSHRDAPNPLVGNYLTKDNRYITLMMLQIDRFFPEVVTLLGLSELVTDPRFVDGASRFDNRVELIRILDDVFVQRHSDEWRKVLQPLSGAWSVMQQAGELHVDPAVVANGYIPTVHTMSGLPYHLATGPVQFDERPVVPIGAPEHGQHTEEVLLEAGFEWNAIEEYKQDGAIL